jgi:PKD repeat protein
MSEKRFLICCLFWLSPSCFAYSETRYVVKDNLNAAAPYTNWLTAAATIQAAVDAAVSNDTIWVTNGVYETGGRTANGVLTNRVVIDKQVIVRSVNGPKVTFIRGNVDPQYTNGESAVRCVYLGTNAALIGFTLTNGHTRSIYFNDGSGGGIFSEPSTFLSDCVLTGNSAYYGGGAYGGTLFDCALIGNSADRDGGGAYNGMLYNCTLTSNSAGVGGGTGDSILYNCELTGNSASYYGGGAAYGTLYNCALTGNSASYYGGGVEGGTLYNCTLIGNSADCGGGVDYSTLYNCIIYYNRAKNGSNYSYSTLNYCCTTPAPAGEGNITAEPLLVNASHLSVESPCIGKGDAACVSGSDIDGEAWSIPPSIGCDEVHEGAVTGLFSVAMTVSYTNVNIGFTVAFTAWIEGRATASCWDFGDGIAISNRLYASHSWSSTGVYPVTLTAWNESVPQGVSTTLNIIVFPPIHYVRADSLSPAYPFVTWDTAASNIQDAVDAATSNDTILVTNGVYETGGRVTYGSTTNRVMIDKPITVASINGLGVTTIKGAWDPSTTNGDAAVRCVWMTNGASLIGFTLTNGATRSSGDTRGGGVWCQSTNVAISNCALSGNSALLGGGGASAGTLYNCTLSGNSAAAGGGVEGGTLFNCRLTGNSASYYGGGAAYGRLYNCTLTDNLASYGGGAYSGTLYNCALTRNSADRIGGGVYYSTLYNCIVYYNMAPTDSNFSHSTLNYCCTTPYPGGTSNITDEPLLTDISHLSEGSPCIGKGNAAYAYGMDIDGEAWFNPPSIGCDEVHAGSVNGPLSVAMTVSYTNVSVGFPVVFKALIEGRVTASRWDFGDGVAISNHLYTSHTWSNTGAYPVTLTAWNGSVPQGVSTTVNVIVFQGVHYVRANSAAPEFPFATWDTAASNIQGAVDAAVSNHIIWVTNGVYDTGGRTANGALTNRVVITNQVTVRSVNGPEVTLIRGNADPQYTNGESAVRCVYLGANTVLIGFTLTNGHTRTSYDNDVYGGGIFCEPSAVLSNCVLTGNSANWGGGTFDSTLYNCTLTGNSAHAYGGGVMRGALFSCALTGNSAAWGGGAHESGLYNCTLTGNMATYYGGGALDSTLYNCIIYSNTASNDPNFYGGTLNCCCTAPDPGGVGNITNNPLFVDYAGGNLRLQSNSPCINTGTNQEWMIGSTDLDGNPRIRRSQVDMGAYESNDWGQFSDMDADGSSDWIEVYRTGTDPTNAASYLGMGTPFYSDRVGTGIVVRWQSANGKTYRLVRTTNLMENFTSLSNHLDATPPMNVYTDRTVIGLGPWYYRVGVE